MAEDTVRIQGKAFSRASCVLKLKTRTIEGWKEISWSHKRERVKDYGGTAEQKPIARTRGKYSADNVKIKLRVETAQLLREIVAAESDDGKSYGDPEFQGTLQYVEGRKKPVVVEFKDLCFAVEGNSESDSPDPSYEEVEFDCMEIKKNGLTLGPSATR